jgi:hypothetical protein
MREEDKFYDLRSAVESALERFKKVCDKDGSEHDFDEEVADIIDEIKRQ